MISVIIPTYNEAGTLTATLDSVAENYGSKEVIVVDAGSKDGTVELAKHRADHVLFSARTQRSYQLNIGAKHSSGATLLFLHADTILPASALDCIKRTLMNDQIVGGGFSRRYNSESCFLRVTCWLASLRTRWTGWFLGDQAIFIRRAKFEELGGYRDIDLFEDLEFSRRMAKTGRLVTLKPDVISSARRFESRGEVLTTLSDFWLTCRYLAGGNPNALAKALRRLPEQDRLFDAADSHDAGQRPANLG